MIVRTQPHPEKDGTKEGVPDGSPHTHRIDLIDEQVPVDISIRRRAMRLHGTAYDITRLQASCKKALQEIEHKHKNPHDQHVVVVQAPPDDEH